MCTERKLTPAQQSAAEGLLQGLPAGDVFVLRGPDGRGKTAVLRHVHRRAGGVFLGARLVLDKLASRGPSAVEEAFLGMLDRALAAHTLVIVDDLHLFTNIVNARDDQRSFLLDAALTAVLAEASVQRRKLVFGTAEEAPWPIRRRAYSLEIDAFPHKG
jgi:ABC-type phosphate/phosphonate transport system ATPase subunit